MTRSALTTSFLFWIFAAAGQKVAYLLHSSEYPCSTFLVLDTMTCLVAERSLDLIFGHLKQFYAPRKQLKIEAKGKVYLVKQYAVKFGAISAGSANRGFIVEVRWISLPPSPLSSFLPSLLPSLLFQSKIALLLIAPLIFLIVSLATLPTKKFNRRQAQSLLIVCKPS